MAKRKKSATTLVKYRKGIKMIGVLPTGKPILEPIYAHHRVVNTCTKRYHNSLCLLAGVTGCPRDLIDRLTEVMGPDNMVYNTIDFREGFIDFIARVTEG